MLVLLPLFHRLDTNPIYITILGISTGLGAALIKAFTDQVHLLLAWGRTSSRPSLTKYIYHCPGGGPHQGLH